MANATSLLRYSSIIPLEFHRGQAQACLRSWAREQTFACERFEIIAAALR